jgi:electron transport complex protein RnfB
MDYMNIVYAVIALGTLGLVLGALLAVASKVFAVKTDRRVEKIIEVLPGANCGGCGFAGCGAFAGAVVSGAASPSGCTAVDAAVIEKIAAILGTTVQIPERKVAVIQCSGGGSILWRYEYVGIQSCFAAMRITGGPTECAYACLGLGDCVKACKFGSLRIERGVAAVTESLCVGCGICAKVCPRRLIDLLPAASTLRVVSCSSRDRGNITHSVCDAGCIGCGLCVKACEAGAITITDNLARIDPKLCVGCGKCETVCPRKIIHSMPELTALIR